MFGAILTFHIITAIAMGVFSLLIIWGVWRNASAFVTEYAQLLAFGLGLELVSGSLLAILFPESISVVEFCRNVFLYLFFTGSILSLAFVYIKKPFPSFTVLVPILPGLILSTYAVFSLS